MAISIVQQWMRAFTVVTVVAGAALSVLSAPPIGAAGDPVGPLRQVYEEHIAKLRAAHAAAVAAAPAKYRESLERLLAARQAAGDLDGWTTVNRELERFKADGIPEPAQLVRTPADLRALQDRLLELLAEAALTRNQEVLSLTDKYLARLESDKERLTREGRIEDALAVNDEIARVKSSPTVSAARFDMAVRDAAEQSRPADADTTPKPVSPAEENAWDPAEPLKMDGITLYGPSLRPDDIQGTTLRYSSLSTTPHGPLRKTVTAKLWIASVDTGSSYSSYDPGKRYHVRVAVRSAGDSEQDDARVVIQCYTKQRKSRYSSSSSGKLVPSLVSTFRATVPHVGTRFVHIDLPRLPTEADSYDSDWYRQDFYGVIVSVLSSSGELLYQAASVPSLRDVAQPRP